MVVGHDGNRNIWGLSEQFLPSWVERKELSADEAEREAALRTIRALGTASPSEINLYFLRGRYLNLREVLRRLEEGSTIHRVHVTGLGGRDERYIHDLDIPLLESLNSDRWQPRMSLLAPFDNLVSARQVTRKLFGLITYSNNSCQKANENTGPTFSRSCGVTDSSAGLTRRWTGGARSS